jgi:NAD(P)-dependent dehydrogenase (short-subunit alcohol dehydrogenase family)
MRAMNNLSGKVAVVVGGSGGIGLAISQELLHAGMKVIITYRRPESLGDPICRLQEEYGSSLHMMQLDVTKPERFNGFADEAEQVFGKLHVLCNSAGVSLVGPTDAATIEDWNWVLDTNLHGVVRSIVTLLPRIRAHGEGGHIINVASIAAFFTSSDNGVYAASKFAIRGLSESLRYALAPQGIGVTLVCPGLTKSRMFKDTRLCCHAEATRPAIAEEMTRRQLEAIEALAMNPAEVARKVIAAVLDDRFYVFTHPEFNADLIEAAEEIVAALPLEEPDARRAALEARRRALKARRPRR